MGPPRLAGEYMAEQLYVQEAIYLQEASLWDGRALVPWLVV